MLNRKLTRFLHQALLMLLVAVAYWATAQLGSSYVNVYGVALIWAPAGVGLTALTLGGLHFWPAILLADLVAGVPFAGWPLGLAAGTAHTVALVIGAALLRASGPTGDLTGRRRLADFALFGGVLVPVTAATLGSLAFGILDPMGWAGFGENWSYWFVGHLLGLLLVAPALFSWLDQRSGRRGVPRLRGPLRLAAEPTFLVLALAVTSVWTWWQPPAAGVPPMSFLSFPLVAWGAVRFGVRGASAAALLITVCTLLSSEQSKEAQSGLLIAGYLGALAATALATALMSDRYRAAARGAESEERLKLALEGAEDGIWDWDLLNDEMAFNERWTAMLGYEQGEIDATFRGFMKLVHPDDADGVKKALEAHLMGKIPVYQTEHRMRAHSGEWRWILARGKVVRRDPNGRPLRVSGTHKDITERKRSRQALLRSEALVRSIFQTAPDGILLINDRGCIESINAAGERIFGYPGSEIVGRDVSFLLPEAPDDHFRSHVARYAGTSKQRQGGQIREVVATRRDGSLVPVDLAVGEVPSASGRRLFSAVVRDASDRKKAEEVLKLHQAMVENMSEGMLVIRTKDGVIVYANPRLEEMFEYEAGALEKQHASVLYAPQDGSARDLTRSMMESLDRKGIWRGEVRSLKRSGRTFWCRIKAAVFDHPAYGKVWVSVHEDISDLVRAEEERHILEDQLRHSHKMESVGQLAGGVAHAFNNLLLGIGGHLEFIESEVKPGSPAYLDLRAAQSAIDRAASLTRKLLAFSRQEVLAPVDVNLDELLTNELMPMLRSAISEDIAMDLQTGSGKDLVHVDVAQIEQVILNLCVNARDAMPDGGRITIRTSSVDLDTNFAAENAWAQEGPYVLLEISDTGDGIPEDIAEQVFEPFFTTKTTSTNTGLGLAIVASTLREHDAGLQMQSRPGEGTIFRVFLPRAAVESTTQGNESGIHIRGGVEKILLAEDETLVRNVARRILEKAGYTVLVAEDGHRATKIFEKSDDIDLVILDLIMPVLGGMAARDKMLKIRPNIPFLLASGYSVEVARHSTSGSDVPLVTKPYRQRTLLKKVREVLDEARKSRRRDVRSVVVSR